MKFLAIFLSSIVLVACGGGKEPVTSPPGPVIKATAPAPVKKGTTVTGGNGVVIHMYQALYGMAPSNALLLDYAFQANNDASTFVKNLTDRFATTSHADLAKLILDNLGVTPTSVPAVNGKGESEYALLLDAVKQLFAAYPTMRGQVILNMTNLLELLETDVTYGAAAKAYTTQSLVDFAYSSNPNLAKIDATVDAPRYAGNVQTMVISYNDGTKASLNNAATNVATSWASDGVTRITEYTFADGTKYSTNQKVSLLSSEPLLLPDLRAIYSSLCGPGGDDLIVFHKPVVLDLNKDGRKDIVINLSCNQRVVGVTTLDPVRNRIVAFLQQSDGTFVNATKPLFGTDVVDIGGASVNAVAYDFNGDGYDDIVFAVNKEDGRLLPDITNNVQNSYLLSDGKGQYTFGRFGTYQWGYDFHLMDNELGRKDVISTPIGYGTGPDAWRYLNGWNQLSSSYRWISTPFSVIFRERVVAEGSRIAITGIGQDLSLGLSLYERSSSTDWSHVSDLSFGTYTWIPWTGWNTSVSPIQLISVDGQDYVNPTLQLGCELKIRPTTESVAVMIFGSYKLPTAVYNGAPLFEGVNMTYQSKLMGVSVANHSLARSNLSIKNEVTDFSPYRMICEDVNGDGYDDIVVLQLDRSTKSYPLIYINDRQGGFSLVDQKYFPPALPVGYGVSSIYTDIDGDGISDLVYWTEGGVDANGKGPVQIQIYKGLRNITAADLK